ncbi:MAG: serine/threonine protein kinase [Planctomycetes bacterium]|nr:serine/threonine protein kinase [Planctomycetota bacterium]
MAKKAVRIAALTKEQASECLRIFRELSAIGISAQSVADIAEEKGYINKTQKEIILMPPASQAPAVPADEMPRIPGYSISKKLGAGAMGEVWRGKQISMDRPVAIKILNKRLSRDAEYVKRFVEEARASARLNHPNIISGIDVGEAQGVYYFAMEFIEGKTLREALEEGSVTEDRALEITLKVAQALDHAEKHKMVHRDIKPDNIMIDKEGSVKVLDLGLAVFSEKAKDGRALIIGTPNYMAPEAARGEPEIDCRADIYSLGCTFYHCLTGRTPFKGPPQKVMIDQVDGKPLSPLLISNEVSEESSVICEKMMAKDKNERYQKPSDLIEDLRACIEYKDIKADPPILFIDDPEEAGELLDDSSILEKGRSSSSSASKTSSKGKAGVYKAVVVSAASGSKSSGVMRRSQAPEDDFEDDDDSGRKSSGAKKGKYTGFKFKKKRFQGGRSRRRRF